MSEQTSKYQPTDWREARRIRAWELYQQGWKQCDIAKVFGVSDGAVSQWLDKGRAEGVDGLRSRKATGRPPSISREQLAQLPSLLEQGAEAHGFEGDVWTRGRVAQVIEESFGVRYTDEHVGRLLKEVGWSRQKPQQRATQRDEAAIDRWRTEQVETLKKKPKLKD